ncbi:MAG: hypothetical protein GY774_22920 [Planctomycetes bacterium]|nr:hypothetical protein [Planctomycetota bacterium]
MSAYRLTTILLYFLLSPAQADVLHWSEFSRGNIVASGRESHDGFDKDWIVHAGNDAYQVSIKGNSEHPLLRAFPVKLVTTGGVHDANNKLCWSGRLCTTKGNVCLDAKWHRITKRPVYLEIARMGDFP